MNETFVLSLDFLRDLHDDQFTPVTVRYIFKWICGTKLEFAIGGAVFENQPSGLGALSEDEMQKRTVLEVINAPAHLKGEWKPVFDEHKNVTVKYFPTPEEEERHQRNMEDDDIYYCF